MSVVEDDSLEDVSSCQDFDDWLNTLNINPAEYPIGAVSKLKQIVYF